MKCITLMLEAKQVHMGIQYYKESFTPPNVVVIIIILFLLC